MREIKLKSSLISKGIELKKYSADFGRKQIQRLRLAGKFMTFSPMKNNVRECLLGALAVVVIAAVYSGVLSVRTMPYAEGWYTYYGQLINGGETVYKDFQYLFTPLYINLIAAFTKVFGYDILALRILGVIVFCLIALAIYITLTRLFSAEISAVSALVAVFYLQSEIVQVFYDYVRFMDLFAIISAGLLLEWSLRVKDGKQTWPFLLGSGISTTLFILIKQNMGLLFTLFAFILIIFTSVFFKRGLKDSLKDAAAYILPVILICGAVLAYMNYNGSLALFLTSVSGGAVSAKGGIFAILFNWLLNGYPQFLVQVKHIKKLLQLGLILLIWMYCVFDRKNIDHEAEIKRSDRVRKFIFGIFVVLTPVIILAFARSRALTESLFTKMKILSPYLIFDVAAPVFFALGIFYLYEMVRKKNHTMPDSYYPFFVISGSYFAISYGCGTSGGLAEGQAYWGVALICAIALWVCAKPFRGHSVFFAAGTFACALFVLTYAGKKMISTYNWWGMTESNFWESSERVEDVPVISGIYLSAETKSVYENIYRDITENTDEDDPIFCFPQIPIFYSICGRNDPGTYSKVQWFDVATDDVMERDMKKIKENPPKAILIYNTSEYAYSSHESGFRSGEESGTRRMREFLWNYAANNGYEFFGNYISGNNTLSLWIDTGGGLEPLFDGGTGTMRDPYIISSPQQLGLLGEAVDAGRSFHGQYIVMANDIDLSGYRAFRPIGEVGSECYFEGTFDGRGYTIRNLSIHDRDSYAGLFGSLRGTVCNLRVENASVTGLCCGVIASQVEGSGTILNCSVQGSIEGFRAGGITDYLMGTVVNCSFVGEATGESAGAISCPTETSIIRRVFVLDEDIFEYGGTEDSHDSRVTKCERDTMQSSRLLSILNSFEVGGDADEEEELKLCRWKAGRDGYPTLVQMNEETVR